MIGFVDPSQSSRNFGFEKLRNRNGEKMGSEKKRLSDLDCQQMSQNCFGWFEAYYRVLPFGCGKMTTAHFETESTRALKPFI